MMDSQGAALQDINNDAETAASWMNSVHFPELGNETFARAWKNGHRAEAERLLARLYEQTAQRASELMADPEWVKRVQGRIAALG